MNITENTTASQLNSSFVKALGELRNVAKNAINPHFKNRYASLDAILDDVRPILSKHGLGISQEPLFEDGKAGVVTRIIHESGETRESTLLLPLKDQSAQGVGSALTYAKRYAISSVLMIAADDDEDGEIASKPVIQKPAVKAGGQSVRAVLDPVEPTAIPNTPLDMLLSMMWSDDITDSHVIEFMIANKTPNVTRQTKLAEVNDKLIDRIVAAWEKVKAFKPAL
jgi:hypothetical protein